MKKSQIQNEKEIVETLSCKYNYDDFTRMQKNGESISVSIDDIEKVNNDRITITKHTPNPFSKRLLIEFLILIAVIAINITLYCVFERNKIIDYVSGIGTGLIAMELSSGIIGYFKFKKLKK